MYEIRTITADDAELYRNRLSRGFGGDVDTDDDAADRFDAIFEYERTLAAFDGSDIIGTASGFTLGVTAPGGSEVPMGGTTVVTVQPTHRRRGVLRSLMDRHLDDVASRDEPLAGLWASESSIYGRFGYGPATFRHVAEVASKSVRFLEQEMVGSVRLVEAEEAEPIIRSLYEQARPKRAGMLTRSDGWWTYRRMADPQQWREGKSARRHLVFQEGSKVTGYATYRQKGKWDDFLADGLVDVVEMISITPVARREIWRFLTSVDLFPNVNWWNMPQDDPLPFLITDARRVKRKLVDALWVRVMDVAAALEARSYDQDGRIVFEVADPTRPENSGTYQLEVVDGEGKCERVSRTADASFEIDVLGHLYLGGGNAFSMASAGRVAGAPEAITTLHRIMGTDIPPWCPEVF